MKSMTLPLPPKGFPQYSSHVIEHLQKLLEARKLGVSGKSLENVLHGLALGERSLIAQEMLALGTWYDHGRKVIFPQRDIFEACLNTEILECVDGSDIKTVYPSMLFWFPNTPKIDLGNGSHILGAIICICNSKQMQFQINGKSYPFNLTQDRYIVGQTFWSDTVIGGSFAFPLKDESLDKTLEVYLSKNLNDQFEGLSNVEMNAGYRTAELVMNMLLLMQSYPEYVATEQGKSRDIGKEKAQSHTYHVLGKTSRLTQVIRDKPRQEKYSLNSKEISPHWRRGHWRRQQHKQLWEEQHKDVSVIVKCGVRYHMAWIEPVFVESKIEK